MQNYVFYLIDDGELKAHRPGPTPVHSDLETWARTNGAHWGELRQRAGFLWEAIDKLDTAVTSSLRFKDRISVAEIGPPWGDIQGVGYYPAAVAAELADAIAPIVADRASIEKDTAYVQLVDVLEDVTHAARDRAMGFVVLHG